MKTTKYLLIAATTLLLPLGAFAGYIGDAQMNMGKGFTLQQPTINKQYCQQLVKENASIPADEPLAIAIPQGCNKYIYTEDNCKKIINRASSYNKAHAKDKDQYGTEVVAPQCKAYA